SQKDFAKARVGKDRDRRVPVLRHGFREREFGRMHGAGKIRGEDGVEPHASEPEGEAMRLGSTGFVEGNVEMSLNAALFVPVGLSVSKDENPEGVLSHRSILAGMW